MSHSDTSVRSEPASDVDATVAAERRGRESASMVAPSLRRGVDSGAVTAIVVGASLLAGHRALLGGVGCPACRGTGTSRAFTT